ncbi:F-box family protein [Euphorbia peplus]|nr:F-box family protein [Euphorbia peplus]
MNQVTIPPEIVEEILLNLPAKSLLRFKSVCKAWSSLIFDPIFKRRHGFKPSSQRILLSSSSGFRLMDCEKGSIRRLKNPRSYSRIVGSSNGLVCIDDGHCQDFIICNLSTEYYSRNVPNPELIYPSDAFIYGFGYDSFADDHKIVVISNSKKRSPRIAIEIFSLRKNSWKTIRDIDYDGGSIPVTRFFRRGAVTFNGVLHWPMLNRRLLLGGYFSIIVFDSQKEEAIVLATSIRRHYTDIKVGVIDGCLCLSVRTSESIELWVLKEYGKVNSWQQLFWFPLAFPELHTNVYALLPLYRTTSGEILLLKDGKELIKVCCKNKIVRKVMDVEVRDRMCEADVYVKPLESPLGYI